MKTNKKQTSIRYRILRLALISVCVAIGALSLLSMIQLNYISTNAYTNEIQSLAVAYTNNMQSTASTIRMQIESAATNEIINNETNPDVLREELAKLASTTSFHDFSIANHDGTTLNNTDISDREYFQEALNGKTYIYRDLLLVKQTVQLF